jgi:hypothetical protein
MKTDQRIDKGISDIVGVFCDPIIASPGGWGDSLPDWLKHAITLERLIENVRALKEGDMTGTDAEACAYLFTRSLEGPLDSDWTDIYLYVANQVYSRHRTKDSGVQFPEDIRVESISDYQMNDLRRLKTWIYETRIRARQDRDRGERREKREEDAARKEMEHPALFPL